jgi:hypothetical protein
LRWVTATLSAPVRDRSRDSSQKTLSSDTGQWKATAVFPLGALASVAVALIVAPSKGVALFAVRVSGVAVDPFGALCASALSVLHENFQ